MPKRQTKPSTPRLSELARRVAVPKSATSTGWPAVRDKCGELGIAFRQWQVGAGQVILAKRGDGKYAATIGGTGMSIPRQVGKTFLVGAIIFALCLLRPNLTVIWTAHRLRTAEETFGKMLAFAKRKRIAPHILKTTLGSGEEAIIFRNGSRILFGARERGFGRGFDEVDVLIFDEAQILSDNALDDMVPATNQSRQETGALMLFMGTPPKPTDNSEVFRRMRSEALSGEDDDTAWIEFGADSGFVPTAQPAPLGAKDWEQVAKANPSFPDDTPREAILRMRKKLGAESFLREGLGIWDEINAARWAMPAWPTRAVTGPQPSTVTGLSLAVDQDRVWLSLGACLEGGLPHLGSVRRVRLDVGRAELLKEAARIANEHSVPIVLDRKGPASSLESELEALGARVLGASLDDYVQACADLFDAVESGQVEHGDYDELNKAVERAGKRNVGERWAWSRRSGDVSMLEAVTLALWGASHDVSVYNDRDLVVL